MCSVRDACSVRDGASMLLNQRVCYKNKTKLDAFQIVLKLTYW